MSRILTGNASDRISYGTSILQFINAYTLQCWLKLTKPTDGRLIFRWGASNPCFIFFVQTQYLAGGSQQGGAYVVKNSTSDNQKLKVNIWNHVAVTYDVALGSGSNFSFYINGVLQQNLNVQASSNPGTLNNSGLDLAVGYETDESAAGVIGKIAFVQMFASALNQRQIISGMNFLTPRGTATVYTPYTDLSTKDYSGNGNNGTVTGIVPYDNDFPPIRGNKRKRRRMIFQTGGIQFDAASNSGYQAAQSTYSWSHTCTGSNRFLSVDISMLSAGQTVTGITYNSVALSLIKAQSTVTSFGRVECWGLVNPASGSNTIAVTLSGSITSAGTAASYTGVHQTSPTEAANSAQATNVGAADATVSITTVAVNDWVHGAVATDDASITANQTSRNNVTGAGGSGADEDTGPVATPGATTMSYTNVGALATWAIAGYAIRPIGSSSLGGFFNPYFFQEFIARMN